MQGSIEKIWRRRWYSVKSGAWTDEGTRRLYAFVSSGYGAKLRAWFDFVSYILKILNASNTFASLTKLNSFPAKWCSWDVLPTKVSLIKTWLSQNKHQNATASSLACKGENAHLRQASFCFHMVSCFELFDPSLVRERSYFSLWFGVIGES